MLTTSPTIGERLAAYKTRGVHIADIKEPSVRALGWKHFEWKAMELQAACRRSPSDHGDLADAAEIEIDYARAARTRILMHMWSLRWWGSLPVVTPLPAPVRELVAI